MSGMYHCYSGRAHESLPQISISRRLLMGLPMLNNFSATKVHASSNWTFKAGHSCSWWQPAVKPTSVQSLLWNRTESSRWASWQVLLSGAVPAGRQGEEHAVGMQKHNSGDGEWAPFSCQLMAEYTTCKLGCELMRLSKSITERYVI